MFEPKLERKYQLRERSFRAYPVGCVFLIRDDSGHLRRWMVQECVIVGPGLWNIFLEQMTPDEESVYEVMGT